MKDYFNKNDSFANDIGAVVICCGEGQAEMRLTLSERHMSHVGRDHAHAGVLFTLAECASAAAVLSQGRDSMAVQSNMTIIDAVTEGELTALAKVKESSDQGYGSCAVTITAEDGRMIACARFTVVYSGKAFDMGKATQQKDAAPEI